MKKITHTGVLISDEEAATREIRQTEWEANAPTSSLGEMLRMQEIAHFNNEMTRKYGHLRKMADNDA